MREIETGADARPSSNDEAENVDPALAPCPFCGGGENRFDEQTYWTGMRNSILSVTLRHWCGGYPADEFVKANTTIRGRDAQQAADCWNTRAEVVK
jgi:hypothetical protein